MDGRANGIDIDEIYFGALERGLESRAAYLSEACGCDTELRRRVERLLVARQERGNFLGASIHDPAATEAAPAECVGLTIGPYRLMEPIGEGGMGVVYVAEQAAPVRRRVALKVIKPGMDTKQVVARFEAERQALAMMDHPSIARVFDGGATQSGRPYFVMELVRGTPITEYCDREQLSIPERLDLFVLICRAVQHAHQKGIIHRDLKPSNILVTIIDGAAIPKVIDFGIAKAAGVSLTEKTIYTAFHQMVGTPLYMSPEQANLAGIDVDTRSDIYSLGVLLYELLTGTTPFDPETLKKAAFEEMRRILREEEPAKPSTRLSTPGENLSAVSARRKADPKGLGRSMRGELDWIVMKSLEKDRRRRYETANDFAADVMNYLGDRPVTARPPSVGYRFSKYARRNRAALTTGSLVGLALLVGTAVSTWQAIRAKHAETRAEQDRDGARQQAEHAKQQRDIASAKTREVAEQAEALEWQLYVSHVNRAHSEWSANNVAKAEQLLDACPAGLRGWEWRYVKRLCHLDLMTVRRDAEHACGVAFSPDGKRLVTGSGGGWPPRGKAGVLAVWDVATGKEAFAHRELKEVVECVAFSPDGRAIASGHLGGRLTVWDSKTGRETFTRTANAPSALSVVFSPDGRRLAVGFGAFSNRDYIGHCTIFDAATGVELASFTGMPGGVHGVAFSPDGASLALAGTDVVELWDVGKHQRLRTFRGHGHLVFGVAFSPDGRRLATASFDGNVRLWEAATGTLALTVPGPAGGVHCVAFSPDGRRLAGCGEDRTVRLWDATSGNELATFRGHSTWVMGVAFSPDGTRLASAATDGMKLWDVRTGPLAIYPCETGDGRVGQIQEVALSPDGTRLAILSREGGQGAILWDTTTGARLYSIPAETTRGGIAFSPDGERLALAATEPEVKLWDVATKRQILTLRGHLGPVRDVTFSPDGRRLATGGADSTIRLWDAAIGGQLRVFTGPIFDVAGVAFSGDGRRLVAASDRGEVYVWDTESGREEFVRNEAETTDGVALSSDGRLVAWTTGDKMNVPGTVTVCDIATGREIHTLRGHTAPVCTVAFSPDGKRLVSGARDYTVKFWDLATGEEVLNLRGHSGSVTDLSFSSDGDRLASGSNDFTARIWDATPLPAASLDPSVGSAPGQATARDGKPVADEATEYQKALANRYRWLAFQLANNPDPQQRDLARAVACARKAVELGPLDATSWLALGLALGNAGCRSESIGANEQAMRLDPNDGTSYNNLALQLLSGAGGTPGDTARAVKLAKRATDLNPDEWRCWRTLARAYGRAGDAKSARDAWDKAVEVGRDDPIAHSRIAWLLAYAPDPHNRDITRALALAKRAVELAPTSGDCWTAMGLAQYRSGDWKGALASLEKATELREGGSGMDFFFMAMARWHSGDKDQALKFFEQGLRWQEKYHPFDDELRQIRNESEELLGVKPARAGETARPMAEPVNP